MRQIGFDQETSKEELENKISLGGFESFDIFMEIKSNAHMYTCAPTQERPGKALKSHFKMTIKLREKLKFRQNCRLPENRVYGPTCTKRLFAKD